MSRSSSTSEERELEAAIETLAFWTAVLVLVLLASPVVFVIGLPIRCVDLLELVGCRVLALRLERLAERIAVRVGLLPPRGDS